MTWRKCEAGWKWKLRYWWLNHGWEIGIESNESFPLTMCRFHEDVYVHATEAARKLLSRLPWGFKVTDVAVIAEYPPGGEETGAVRESVGVRVRMQAFGPRVLYWWACRTFWRSKAWKFYAKWGREQERG